MKIQNKLLSLLLLAALTAGALAGCEKKDDATQVQERAVARWNALIARDADRAYEFLSSGYRSTVTKDHYSADIKQRAVDWTSAKPISTKCEEDVCTVRLMIGYSISIAAAENRLVRTEGPVTESWIRGSNNWYGGHQWYFLPDSAKGKPKINKVDPQTPDVPKNQEKPNDAA